MTDRCPPIPALSVVMVVGEERERARAVDTVAAQSIAAWAAGVPAGYAGSIRSSIFTV